jgi:hypothetical protein
MAFRFSLLAIEREPRVATSLDGGFVSHGHGHDCVQAGVSLLYTYQIVATPCSGDVRTRKDQVSVVEPRPSITPIPGNFNAGDILLSWL